MCRYIIIILAFLLTGLPGIHAIEQPTTEELLIRLDSVISNRDEYYKERIAHITELQQELNNPALGDRERFDVLGRLFQDYHSFNADSAYAVAQRQLSLAHKLGDNDLTMNAMLNKANILCLVGMYHESLSLIDSVPGREVPDYLRAYYYHSKRTLYDNLANFAMFEPEREQYEKLTDDYRDSLLMVNDPQSVFYVLIKADQLNVHNQPEEAIEMLETFIRDNDLPEHDRAICAFTLSAAYGKMNDIENQKRQLTISAISDIKTAIREYVSLRQLALLLYQEGDLGRAYKFLTIAVDDATKSNARQRIIELNDSYPKINRIYIEKVRDQKRILERTILTITILSVILIVLLFFVRKQMHKVAESRNKVEDANNKLSELNSQLTASNNRLNELNRQLVQSNSKLQEAYSSIAEISELKEVYICQYMDQSLKHIEMLDTYRKTVAKLANAHKIEDLKELVKSSKIIEDELKAFYAQFDKTFLNLFPTFVEDFNNLLLPEEAIVPKNRGLNTELRIFALIRLGITDSDKIARFLRYSLTTIYNYRTKVRNKAKGDRNQLENEVAKIGQHLSDS